MLLLSTFILSSSAYACVDLEVEGLNSLLIYKENKSLCFNKTSDSDDYKEYAFVNTDFNLLNYNSIFIESITVNQQPSDTVNQETLTQIKSDIENHIKSRLSKVTKVVENPDQGSLTLNISISGAELTGEGLGLTDFIPLKAIWNASKKVRDQNIKVPTIIVEAKTTDSTSNIPMRGRVIIAKGEGFVDRAETEQSFEEMVIATVNKALNKY